MSAARQKFWFITAFVAYFAALWWLWYTPFIYPVKLFVVLLHEIGHAAVALATGGEVVQIAITPAEGGLCECPGGSAFLTLSAGYLGSLFWGALLFAGAVGRPNLSRWLMAIVGAIVLFTTLFFVGNGFGILFGSAFGAAMVIGARYFNVSVNRWILAGLGLTSCLYAILDIKSDVLERPHLPSDAHMLAELTGVPTVAWGLLWIAVATLVSGALVRWAWRRLD